MAQAGGGGGGGGGQEEEPPHTPTRARSPSRKTPTCVSAEERPGSGGCRTRHRSLSSSLPGACAPGSARLGSARLALAPPVPPHNSVGLTRSAPPAP
ncbi:unnamed protein product [Pleuronectes platessa]|uniref:Uncharacterized protein n=1 Tax=Pleuronectes platessa TaxID=8262 RepID=A0A9N7U796_PLEPL|nr:unnamed protein product [Pleuronectes platessa]